VEATWERMGVGGCVCVRDGETERVAGREEERERGKRETREREGDEGEGGRRGRGRETREREGDEEEGERVDEEERSAGRQERTPR
jgi:hypothetical protein